MKDLKKIVDQARLEMTGQTEGLEADIDKGSELTVADFQEVTNEVNGIMASAYRKVAPEGRNAENSSYVKELSDIHKKSVEAVNESRNAYRQIAAFIKQRGAIQLSLVAVLEDIHGMESQSNAADGGSAKRVSSYVRSLDGYVEKIEAIDIPGTHWQREKETFISELLEDRTITSVLLNSMVSSLSAEVEKKAEIAAFDLIDSNINNDNVSYWTSDRELPEDIKAARVSQIQYGVDLVVSLNEMKGELKDIPEAAGLVARIDELLLQAGEYLDKSREHYTKFIDADPRQSLQIEKALRDYGNLCENLAAAKENGNPQRVAGAEYALRQHMQIMATMKDRIYDYTKEVPGAEAVAINQFEGLDPEFVDISDARSKYREVQDAQQEDKIRIAALNDGQSTTVDGVTITKTENGYVFAGGSEVAKTPEEALMIASLPVEIQGPAAPSDLRMASAETNEEEANG